MGDPAAPGYSDYEFNGTWSGSFYGPTANDADTTGVDESLTAPKAVAGTFVVTKSETMGTGEDAMMIVESFIGTFSAHKD